MFFGRELCSDLRVSGGAAAGGASWLSGERELADGTAAALAACGHQGADRVLMMRWPLLLGVTVVTELCATCYTDNRRHTTLCVCEYCLILPVSASIQISPL